MVANKDWSMCCSICLPCVGRINRSHRLTNARHQQVLILKANKKKVMHMSIETKNKMIRIYPVREGFNAAFAVIFPAYCKLSKINESHFMTVASDRGDTLSKYPHNLLLARHEPQSLMAAEASFRGVLRLNEGLASICTTRWHGFGPASATLA